MRFAYTFILSLCFVLPLSAFNKPEKGKPAAHLAANIISSTTVRLTWIGTPKDYAYKVRIRPVGVLTWTTYNVQAPTCNRRVTDLKPGTVYQWQVQTQFSKSTRDTSTYTNGPNFKPWEPCETPQGLITLMDGTTDAALMWIPTGEDVQYKVKLRTEGAAEWITYTTDKNVLLLNGLVANSGYEWSVATQCNVSGLESEYSEKSFFAASPDVTENLPIGNYADYNGYDGTHLLTFYANDKDIMVATLQNHMGQRIETLPVYYTSTDGTVAYNVQNNLPPGLYNVSYRCGTQTESRTLMIAGDYGYSNP